MWKAKEGDAHIWISCVEVGSIFGYELFNGSPKGIGMPISR